MNRQSLNRRVDNKVGSPDDKGRLTLPLPPSVNHAYKNVSIQKRIKTDEANAYIAQAGWVAKAWMQQSGWTMPDKSTKVVMRVWIWWANNRRRDADNLFKILSDSLTGIAYIDDCMVLPQVIDFSVDKHNPRVEIELEEVENDADCQ